MPDFAFPGPGVRVESVPEGSPAAAVGVQAGDVLISLDGREVADLRGYSDILKTLEPGRTVLAVFVRMRCAQDDVDDIRMLFAPVVPVLDGG